MPFVHKVSLKCPKHLMIVWYSKNLTFYGWTTIKSFCQFNQSSEIINTFNAIKTPLFRSSITLRTVYKHEVLYDKPRWMKMAKRDYIFPLDWSLVSTRSIYKSQWRRWKHVASLPYLKCIISEAFPANIFFHFILLNRPTRISMSCAQNYFSCFVTHKT